MTLLIAASPCALALGTPAAILAGVAQAARNGVLVKGGAHLENLGRIRALAFDKAGTITQGKPEVTDVITFNVWKEDEVLATAAAVESRSVHPLAQAIVRAADDRGLELHEVDNATAVTGRGIIAEVRSKPVWIGNTKLFQENNIELPVNAHDPITALESEGKTVMVISQAEEPMGLIAVADIVRAEAGDALAALKKLGIKETVMLTGDNARVAANIARQIGLTDYRADLMPEDKQKAVSALVDEYGTVGMVGDGVNDAPALANATVGIAMGGAGTDVALETADVALMADDLSKLPFAVGLGRATRAIIQQNLIISLSVIALLAAFAVSGLAGIGVAIVIHEGSTIVVALNALRLLAYKST